MRDEVFVLADLRWRRRRLNKYIQTQFSLNTCDPYHPAFDEVWGFCMFMHCLRTEPETCLDHAAKYLRADKINQLKQKYPRLKDQPIAEWVKAVTREIISLSSSAIPQFAACAGDLTQAQPDDLNEAAREWKAEQKVAGSIALAPELVEYYAKESEGLDARIARQINFLIELKAKLKILGES